MSRFAAELGAVGVPADNERVYRALLQNPGATVAELIAIAGMSDDAVQAALTGLETSGLVTRAPGEPVKFIPAPPESAVAPLIVRRQHELLTEQEAVERVRQVASLLQREYLTALQSKNPAELVEIVRGRDAVLGRHEQLQSSATREVLGMSGSKRPPDAGPWRANETQLRRMREGITYRAIYGRDFLERQGGLERVAMYVAAGEFARVVSDIPLTMVYIDDEVALVPLNREQPLEHAVVVHRSALLYALRSLFDCFWRIATPIVLGPDNEPRIRPPDAPDALDRKILVMMAAGSKDEAIARQLGLSLTTVRRRVAAMMSALEADTRFQAGINAVRHGWIPK